MTVLWYEKKYTITDYNKDCSQENVEGLVNFIYGRFYERYIEPFEVMDPKKKMVSVLWQLLHSNPYANILKSMNNKILSIVSLYNIIRKKPTIIII